MNINKIETDLYTFSGAIIKIWNSIPHVWIDNLIDSIEQQIRILYRAKDWHIKY